MFAVFIPKWDIVDDPWKKGIAAFLLLAEGRDPFCGHQVSSQEGKVSHSKVGTPD